MPQFLLRNFRSGSKPQVHVFDKSSSNAFRAGVTKVAAVKGFYDAPAVPGANIESALSSLESHTADIIARIVAASAITSLSEEDQQTISLFCAAQLVRVPSWRNVFRDLNRLLRQSLVDMGADPDQAGLPVVKEEDLGNETLIWLHSVPDLAQHFLAKDWALFRSPKPGFYISDNPVTWDSAVPRDPLRGTGIASLGVELYLPLSPSLTLGMFCPSIRARAEASLARVRPAGHVPPEIAHATARLRQFADELANKATVQILPENVVRLNSLQVRTSSRFIYSGSANFDLAREMLRDHPELREGVRIEAS